MQRVQVSVLPGGGEEPAVAWGDASTLGLALSGTLVSSSRDEGQRSFVATLSMLAAFGIALEWPTIFVLWGIRMGATTPQLIVGAAIPALFTLCVFMLWSAVRSRRTAVPAAR